MPYKSSARKREADRRRYHQRRANDQCVRCEAPAQGAFCGACTASEVRRQVELSRQRRQRGLCGRCGQPSDTFRCSGCERHHREKVRQAKHGGLHAALAERDGGWFCRYCGLLLSRDTAHLDRVVPGVQGGEYTLDNCVLACPPCNRRKSGRTPDEARMPLI